MISNNLLPKLDASTILQDPLHHHHAEVIAQSLKSEHTDTASQGSTAQAEAENRCGEANQG